MRIAFLYVTERNGMQIGLKFNMKAKNALGVTSWKGLVLLDDNKQDIDRAPVAQIAFKFSIFFGDSVKINGYKRPLSFMLPMKSGPVAGGLALI